jgi:outer membrane protein assembly factor BamB
MAGYCLTHQGNTPNLGPQTASVRRTLPTPDGAPSSATIDKDGVVYVAAGGTLYAFDPSGATKWTTPLGGTASYQPAIGADGTIYQALADGRLVALDPGGNQEWTYAPGNGPGTSPLVAPDGSIVYGAGSLIHGVSSTGAPKWSLDTLAPAPAPAMGDDGSIYATSGTGAVYAANAMTGEKKWTSAVGSGISSVAAIAANGAVYFGADDGIFRALETTTGALRWSTPVGQRLDGDVALGRDGTTAYVSSSMGFAFAFDGSDGHLLWQSTTGGAGGQAYAPSVGGDGTVYLTWSGSLLALDGAFGTTKWSVPGNLVANVGIGADGAAYVASNNGNVWVIGP